MLSHENPSFERMGGISKGMQQKIHPQMEIALIFLWIWWLIKINLLKVTKGSLSAWCCWEAAIQRRIVVEKDH